MYIYLFIYLSTTIIITYNRVEGRGEGRLRRGLLYDSDEDDLDDAPGRKRRKQAEHAAMEVK